MITPSFSLTATERVLPKLALDFTTASLDSRVTFTRTTGASNPATYVNSSGLIAAATNNQPRFDYDPVALVCNGLLIEESRANNITYSEDVTNAAWSTINNGVLANQAVAPDGTTTMDKVTPTAVSGEHRIYYTNAIPVTAGSTVTFSWFLKANGVTRGRINMYNGAGRGKECVANFNLTAGTINTATAGGGFTAVGSSIKNYGNSIYRVSVSGTLDAGTSQVFCDMNLCDSNGNLSWTPNGTDAMYVWGAQMEIGAFPTSYIPTAATTLTRNADVATMTGTNFSSWYNASEGSFVTQGQVGSGFFPYMYSVSDGTGANRMILYRNSSAATPTSAFQMRVDTSNVNQVATAVNALTTKISFAYKSSDFAVAYGGNAATVTSSGTVPTVNAFYIGSANGAASYANGYIEKIFYWPQRLTNAEAQAFSK